MMLFLVVAIIIFAIAILAVLKSKQATQIEGFSYEKREPLFTPAERSFLGVLEQV